MNQCPRRRYSAHPRHEPLSKTEVIAIHTIVLAVVCTILAVIVGALA